MTDNKEKRVSRVREMKNDLILDAALEIFADKGFHETRLEDIAQAAGFSKASLYNYYKDKSMIFLSLGIREFTRLKERLESDPVLKIDESLPLPENLRRMLTLVFSTFGDHFSFILTLNTFQFMQMLHDIKGSSTSAEHNVENDFFNIRCSVDDLFMHVLKKAKDEGQIQSPLSADQINSMIDSVIFGTIRQWKINQKMEDIPTTVDILVEFLCNGMNIK